MPLQAQVATQRKGCRKKVCLSVTERVSWCTQTFQNQARRLRNQGPDPPKSRPGAFKIEPSAVQGEIFHNFKVRQRRNDHQGQPLRGKTANLPPSWDVKTLQNRGRNPKKSIQKNNLFSASISEGFGRRFERVFGSFCERFFIGLWSDKRALLSCS